jgi:SAM-dependent methyltransferase
VPPAAPLDLVSALPATKNASGPVDYENFRSIYRQAVDDVLARMPQDWSALSRHNAGWSKERFDCAGYLTSSLERYWRAYRIIARSGAVSVLDAGGFLAAFPLSLRRLGFRVALAEHYAYYGSAMDAIAELASASGIAVVDADLTEPTANLAGLQGGFDAVTCMAVAEHLAHSPRALLVNLRSALRPGGTLVFEVPNIAFWPKRFAFFVRGQTVLAPIEDVYHSSVPFTGHHREYTLDEARYVARQAGFVVVSEQTFNYGFDSNRWWNRVKYAPALLWPAWAELIMLECIRPADVP